MNLVQHIIAVDEIKNRFDYLVDECGLDPCLSETIQIACNNTRRSFDLDKRICQAFVKGAADSNEIAAINHEGPGIFLNINQIYAKARFVGEVTWDEIVEQLKLNW